jgi:hypothetical protein
VNRITGNTTKRSEPMVKTTVAVLVLAALLLPAAAFGQAYDGLTLINSMTSRTMKLINNSGQTVKSWTCNTGVAYVPYLMPDSTIWRPGVYSGASMRGAAYGGQIEHYDWNGNIIESFTWSNSYHQQHHDIHPMPNGHVLVVSWDRKTASEAQALGRQNIWTDIWPDEVIEYDPAGDSVAWEWHFWDHMIQDVDPGKPNYGVVSEHPELFDINLGSVQQGDWMHCNTVDYNPERDEIIVTSHNLHEMYVIDHSTTTAEAAGHTGGRHGRGGDFLYRWGNPQNYDRGTSADRVFYVIHGGNWVPAGYPGAGNILVLNNGDRSGTSADSSVITEITPPLDSSDNYYIHPDSAFGPETTTWQYSNGRSFYAQHLGGAYRMPNGNTLAILGTSGQLVEVTADKQVAWQYNNGAQIGRCLKYPLDFTGISGNDQPGTMKEVTMSAGSNPFRNSTRLRWNLPAAGQVKLTVHDATGRLLATLADGRFAAGTHEARLDAGAVPAAGIYFCRLETGTGSGRRVETLALVRN